MKIIEYHGQIKNRDLVKRLKKEMASLDGTLYISDKSGKPKGCWMLVNRVVRSGVYFYITSLCKTGHQIWKKTGESNRVILCKKEDMAEEKNRLKINSDDDCELLLDGLTHIDEDGGMGLVIREVMWPVAFKNKMEELIEGGMSVEEAKRHIYNTPIYLEVYYEKGKGLFAVESDYIEEHDSIVSPYSGEKISK